MPLTTWFFEKFVNFRNLSITFWLFGVIIVIWLFSRPILVQGDFNEILPLHEWYSYNIKAPTVFWVTYLHQLFLTLIAGFATATFDLLFCNCMLQIYSQMIILRYRIKKISYADEKVQLKAITNCSLHLNTIYRFGKLCMNNAVMCYYKRVKH